MAEKIPLDNIYGLVENYEKQIMELKRGTELLEHRLIKDYENQIASLKDQIAQFSGLLKTKDRAGSDLVSAHLVTISKLESLLRDTRDQIGKLGEQMSIAEEENQTLIEAASICNEVLIEKEHELETLSLESSVIKAELEVAKSELEMKDAEYEVALATRNREMLSIRETLSKSIDQIQALSKLLEDTSSEGKKSEEEKEELTKVLRTLSEDKLKLEAEKTADQDKLQSEISALQSENKKLTTEKQEIEKEKETLKSKSMEKEVLTSEVTGQLASLTKEKDIITSEKERLESNVTSLGKEKEELQASLENASKEITRLKGVCEAQLRTQISRDEEYNSKLLSVQKGLKESQASVDRLTERLAAIDLEKDSIELLRYSMEKDFLALRAELEKDIKETLGATLPKTVSQPNVAVLPPASNTPAGSKSQPHSRSGSVSGNMRGMKESKGESKPHSRINSNQSVDSGLGSDDGSEADEPSPKGRKYFSDALPLTADFIAEKIKGLKQADYISVEALAAALARDILRNKDGQLSYYCKDMGNLTFKYLDTKGKWKTDKNMKYLRSISYPSIAKAIRIKIDLEKTVIDREPSDNAIGHLLDMLKNIETKHNSAFVKLLATSLAPKIAYAQ